MARYLVWMARYSRELAVTLVSIVFGIFAAFFYADQLPAYRWQALDRLVDRTAHLITQYVVGERDLSTSLVRALEERLPEIEHLPSARYKLLSVANPVPLPDPKREPNLFNYSVMSTYCDSIPDWSEGGYYSASPENSVSRQYGNVLAWIKPQVLEPKGLISDTALSEARVRYRDYSYRPLVQDFTGTTRRIWSCGTHPDLAELLLRNDRSEYTTLATGAALVENTQNEGATRIDAQVVMSGTRIAVVTLDRSSWFDPGLIHAHRHGPWRSGVVPDFWGKSGTFALVPVKLVVLLNPHIRLTVPQERANELVQAARGQRLRVIFGPQLLRQSDFTTKISEKDGQIGVNLYSSRATVLAVLVRVQP